MTEMAAGEGTEPPTQDERPAEAEVTGTDVASTDPAQKDADRFIFIDPREPFSYLCGHFLQDGPRPAELPWTRATTTDVQQPSGERQILLVRLTARFETTDTLPHEEDFRLCAESIGKAANRILNPGDDNTEAKGMSPSEVDEAWTALRHIVFAKLYLRGQSTPPLKQGAVENLESNLRKSLRKELGFVFDIDGYAQGGRYFDTFIEALAPCWENTATLGFTTKKRKMFAVLALKRSEDAVRLCQRHGPKAWGSRVALEDAMNALACAAWPRINKKTLDESGLKEYPKWMGVPIHDMIKNKKLQSTTLLKEALEMKVGVKARHCIWECIAVKSRTEDRSMPLLRIAEVIQAMFSDGLDKTMIDYMSEYWERRGYWNARSIFSSFDYPGDATYDLYPSSIADHLGEFVFKEQKTPVTE